MEESSVGGNDENLFERLLHPTTSYFAPADFSQIAAQSATAGSEPIVELLPKGKRKWINRFVGSTKEDFRKPELAFHQPCGVEESSDAFDRDGTAGADLFRKVRLLDETGQQEGEVGVPEILPPVFKIVCEDEGNVMLVQRQGETIQDFRPSRKESKGHGERSQERCLALCDFAESGDWIVSDPMGMIESLFPHVLPCLEIAVVEVFPKGMTEREETVEPFQAMHVFQVGKKQRGRVRPRPLV
jgi:hypothetical protein